MQETKISDIPQKIFKFFTHKAEELGKECRFKIRSSKLTPGAFLEALVSCCFSQQFSLELFCSLLKLKNITITKQSLFERFNERTAYFLGSLALLSLKFFETEKLPQLGILNQFTAVNLIDSSRVSLHKTLQVVLKGTGGDGPSAAIKIQMMFDYLSGQIKNLVLTAGCNNDQGFDNFLDSIKEGALYLMDLGYFKLTSFQKINAGNAFFISRFLTGTKIFSPDEVPLNLVFLLSHSEPWVSYQVLLGVNAKLPVRLVAQRLPEELANRRKQKLKETLKRRTGKTPPYESLALQSWSICITNTTEQEVSFKELYHIYAVRWQIELIFKLSKSLMQIDSLRTTKYYRVLIEMYGKFICMILLFFLCAPVRYKQNREISFYKAGILLSNKACNFLASLASPYRLKKFLDCIYDEFSLFALKDIKKRPPMLREQSEEMYF